LPDSNLKAINRLLSNVAFEDDDIELLIFAISDTAKLFEVSKDSLSWRLIDFGLLEKPI